LNELNEEDLQEPRRITYFKSLLPTSIVKKETEIQTSDVTEYAKNLSSI
jgi:hypothetical protein